MATGSWNAYSVVTHTAPTVAVGTTLALAANASRTYALFINDADEAIYLGLGVAAVMNKGIRLNANGGSYEMSAALGNLYAGAVNAICASGGKLLLVTEAT
jgi:hypothetical protein